MKRPLRPLTDRDVEVLVDLKFDNDQRIKLLEEHPVLPDRHLWAKPMDLGGFNGSHHSNTLKKLVRHGLVEIMSPSAKHVDRSKYPRSGALYRIVVAGRDELKKRGIK